MASYARLRFWYIAECVPHGVLLIWWYNTVVDLNAGSMARLAGNNDWLLICLLGSLRHGYLTKSRDFFRFCHAFKSHLMTQASIILSDANEERRSLKSFKGYHGEGAASHLIRWH